MKRIGIVTYHNAWNNGAFLQAFALQSYLEGHGLSVNVVDNNINFKSSKYENPLANKWWRAYEKRILECQQLLHIASDKEYDTVVYGSDEIWNLANEGSNPIFWGFGLKADKKIAYAPCSGGNLLRYLLKHPFKGLMVIWALNRNFNAISARDCVTKEFAERFLRKHVEECLDPTFLFDFSQYKGVNKYGDYLLIYSYGLSKESVNLIKEFAQKNKCKIIYTGSFSDWADDNPILNPLEWLNVMYHAKYVFTSTFHGSVFSIICERQFYVVDTNSNKVKDLLQRLNLIDRFIKDSKVSLNTIDYLSVNQKLNLLRGKSKDFLINNI